MKDRAIVRIRLCSSRFYLIKAMGSEQAGLTGVKGSMVQKVAVGRTASSLEKSLIAIKDMLQSARKPLRGFRRNAKTKGDVLGFVDFR